MKRYKHGLSHYTLSTLNMGNLVPLTWYEVLPGDTFSHATSALLRATPLLSPVMHPVRVRFHHWFVPNRLIWDEFEDFITGGPDGTSIPEHPYIDWDVPVDADDLANYLGLPPGTQYGAKPQRISALPFRAYNLIFNEFYRDQDLIDPIVINYGSGDDGPAYPRLLLNVCWSKDYFTTCRPWPQKGDEVTIPVQGLIQPATSDSVFPRVFFHDGFQRHDSDLYASYVQGGTTASLKMHNITGNPPTGDYHVGHAYPTGLQAGSSDIEQGSYVAIDDLRLALGLQHYEEARAQYGSRYSEYLRYLGVRSSDARLQRPEYLGGGKQVIQWSEVIQTAPDTSGEGVGELFGHGASALRTNRYVRFFEEHGIVMTLLSVLPVSMYVDGIARKFYRKTKEDYYQKELAMIGEQPVYNRELQGPACTDPEGVFGYQERYQEYRSNLSRISGEMSTLYNHWHLGREFASDVALNGTFVYSNPSHRIFANQVDDSMLVMANHHIRARRIVGHSGTPKIV